MHSIQKYKTHFFTFFASFFHFHICHFLGPRGPVVLPSMLTTRDPLTAWDPVGPPPDPLRPYRPTPFPLRPYSISMGIKDQLADLS